MKELRYAIVEVDDLLPREKERVEIQDLTLSSEDLLKMHSATISQLAVDSSLHLNVKFYNITKGLVDLDIRQKSNR